MPAAAVAGLCLMACGDVPVAYAWGKCVASSLQAQREAFRRPKAEVHINKQAITWQATERLMLYKSTLLLLSLFLLLLCVNAAAALLLLHLHRVNRIESL